MEPLEVDGSHGEGGGQLTRLAVALAAMTGRSLHLTRIRAARDKPGLRAQHLAAVRAVAVLCAGSLEGDVVGSAELRLRPGRIRGGTFRFEVGTAGSMALVMQAVLPVLLRAGTPSRVTITGGTDVPKAPPLDYLRLVFLPLLARMGAEVGIDVVRRGYYPRGGGEVQVQVAGGVPLAPLRLVEPGALQAFSGVAHVAHLPAHIAERMAAATRGWLGEPGSPGVTIQVLGDAEACGPGGAIVVAARMENTVLGAGTVAQRGVPAERLGGEVGQELRLDLDSGATVDVHAADQLLIYAAQAPGPSVLTVRRVSQHATTVMWLIEQFLPVRFGVEACHGVQRIEVAPASHRGEPGRLRR